MVELEETLSKLVPGGEFGVGLSNVNCFYECEWKNCHNLREALLVFVLS